MSLSDQFCQLLFFKGYLISLKNYASDFPLTWDTTKQFPVTLIASG